MCRYPDQLQETTLQWGRFSRVLAGSVKRAKISVEKAAELKTCEYLQ